MTKCARSVGILVLAGALCAPSAARAEADESVAKDLAKAMLDLLDENEKAFSQLRSLLASGTKECAAARADAEADLDLRLRHVKSILARVKELEAKASAETVSEAERIAKPDVNAKMERTASKMPETQKVLKRFHDRCPDDAEKLKAKTSALAQAQKPK